MSIAKRLFALIAVTLLLVAGGELYNGLSLRQSRLEELNGDTVQLARIAALDVDRLLEGSHQLLATLAKLPETRGWDERACAMLVTTVNSDFEYDHIVAVDRRGQVRCSSGGSAGRAIGIVADLAFVDRIRRATTLPWVPMGAAWGREAKCSASAIPSSTRPAR